MSNPISYEIAMKSGKFEIRDDYIRPLLNSDIAQELKHSIEHNAQAFVMKANKPETRAITIGGSVHNLAELAQACNLNLEDFLPSKTKNSNYSCNSTAVDKTDPRFIFAVRNRYIKEEIASKFFYIRKINTKTGILDMFKVKVLDAEGATKNEQYFEKIGEKFRFHKADYIRRKDWTTKALFNSVAFNGVMDREELVISEGSWDFLSLLSIYEQALGLQATSQVDEAEILNAIKYFKNIRRITYFADKDIIEPEKGQVNLASKIVASIWQVARNLNCELRILTTFDLNFPSFKNCKDVNDVLKVCQGNLANFKKAIGFMDAKFRTPESVIAHHKELFPPEIKQEKPKLEPKPKPEKELKPPQAKEKKKREIKEPDVDRTRYSGIIFWYETENGLEILRNELAAEMNRLGYRVIKQGNDYSIVHVHDNVLREANYTDISRDILGELKHYPAVQEKLRRGMNQFFSHSFIDSSLEGLDIKGLFHRDTREACHFYFRNGFVQITDGGIEFKDYRDMEGMIWERQKIDSDINILPNYDIHRNKSPFKNFLGHCMGLGATGKDWTRQENLWKTIGYLLHRYKDPTKSKAVIFVDEKLNDPPDGRTGKSLTAKALGYMRNTANIKGKQFSFNKSFIWQEVNQDTDLIVLNDVVKGFDFQSLFNVISDGITIEHKNRDPISIDYEKSPKILLTTNTTIKSEGGSAEDRKIEVPFTDHYNSSYKPENDPDVGRLFDGWSEAQWQEFFNFVFNCVLFYFTNASMPKFESDTMNEQKIINNTSFEFCQFMAVNVNPREEYNKETKFQEFLTTFEGEKSKFTKNRFTKFIKTWCIHHRLFYRERASHNTTYFVITKTKEEAINATSEQTGENDSGEMQENLW